MGYNQLVSNENTAYNQVNTQSRFVAEMIYAKMPIFAAFNGVPNLDLPEATYTKIPRSGGGIYSNTKGGFVWNEENVISFNFKSPRTIYSIFTAQINNPTAVDSACYIRAIRNQNNATVRLTRFKVPAGDEESATLVFGYPIDYNDIVEYEVYSTSPGLKLTRFNILLINAPQDTVALPEMI